MADISVKGLHKFYGAVSVLRDITFDIKDGEFVVFVGRSGCGKSTLLRCIAGLEGLSSGAVLIENVDVTRLSPSRRKIAMVFQSYALYPHLTARENLGFSLKLAKVDKSEAAKRVMRAAEILQIEDLLDRKPGNLSGGQRQRVAMGRAIVREPKAFLFDEPLSNLDADLRVQMRREIMQLHKELGSTMIYVTHDQVEAMTMADKIIVLNGGKIEQIGPPLELYRNPVNEFVATFLGSPRMNVFPASPASSGVAGQIQLAGGMQFKARNDRDLPRHFSKVGIRPEHCAIAPLGSGHVTGKIVSIEHLGSDRFCFVAVSGIDNLVTVRDPGTGELPVGSDVSVKFAESAMHFFDVAGLALRVSSAEAVGS